MSDDEFDYSNFSGHINVRYRKRAPASLDTMMNEMKAALINEYAFRVMPGNPDRRIACVIRATEDAEASGLVPYFLRDLSAVAERHGCYLDGEIVYNDEGGRLDSVGYVACSRRGGMVHRSMIDRCAQLERENAALRAQMDGILHLHATMPGKLRTLCTAINTLRTCTSTLQGGLDEYERALVEPPAKKRKVGK